jgi:hypothetical protein
MTTQAAPAPGGAPQLTTANNFVISMLNCTTSATPTPCANWARRRQRPRRPRTSGLLTQSNGDPAGSAGSTLRLVLRCCRKATTRVSAEHIRSGPIHHRSRQVDARPMRERPDRVDLCSTPRELPKQIISRPLGVRAGGRSRDRRCPQVAWRQALATGPITPTRRGAVIVLDASFTARIMSSSGARSSCVTK